MTRQKRPVRRQATSHDPFWDLVAVATRLHGPGGCPWDRAQTVRSLLPHLIEETWEVFCAQRKRNRAELQEELGDVLYTVLFLTLLAQREGWFDLEDVLLTVQEKMIRRHPHVFGTEQARSPAEAYTHWQTVKQGEKRRGRASKKLRPLIVELWDALRTNPQAPEVLQQTLQELANGVSARAKPSRGR